MCHTCDTASHTCPTFCHALVAQTANKVPWISVKNFGARGDGVADDYRALQDAIDFAYANDIYTVYLPNGIYKISYPLVLKTKKKTEDFGWMQTELQCDLKYALGICSDIIYY